MNGYPTVTIHILGPNEGIAEGENKGLWFKLRSEPPPTKDLVVGLKVRSPNGEVKQFSTIVIPKHETYSADLFYKTVEGHTDVWLEIEPVASLSAIELPTVTNEGYVIEARHEFSEYSIGGLSKIVPYQWNGPERGLWTDEKL